MGVVEKTIWMILDFVENSCVFVSLITLTAFILVGFVRLAEKLIEEE